MADTSPADGAFSGTHAVIIRADDLERLAAFYQDLGFPLHRRTDNVVQLRSGDGSLLEIARIAPGVAPNGEVNTRIQARMSAVFHTEDLPGALERAEANGGRTLDTLYLPAAVLVYIADPEGNVVGLRQATPEPPATGNGGVTLDG
jgi:catechol 2,3-dioxygenase-like lactoylglutathione lyase family enzyme